jgi:hypothetical protein
MKKWTFLLVAILVTLSLLLSGCAKKEYSLTIAVSGQGTTVPATSTYTYQDGQSVTISATPASGWKFDSWSGDASGTNATVSLLMDGKKGITANFSKITYNLTLAVNGNGTTNPTAGARIYDAGTVVNITANPGTGWKFDSWSGGVAAPSSASTTVTMDSDKMVTANFSTAQFPILMQDSFALSSYDWQGMKNKYGNITKAPADLPFLPFNEYGLYASTPFFAATGQVVELVVQSDYPIVIDKWDTSSRPSLQGKLWVLLSDRNARGIDSKCFTTPDNLRRVGDHWENSTIFTPNKNDDYVFLALGQYCGACWCRYTVTAGR